MSKLQKIRIIEWAIYFAIDLGVFLTFFFVNTHGRSGMARWIDPLFASGAITIGLGLIALMAHFGSMDFLAYGIRSIFVRMRPSYKVSEDKYHDFNDYVDQKRESRKKISAYPWPWLVFGVPSIIVAIVFGSIVF